VLTAGASTVLNRLIREEAGQDVVEYALLVAFFGVALAAVWAGMVDALQASYGSSTAVEWDSPAPGGAPP
jgi:Flp pilus assembly pilin Flp